MQDPGRQGQRAGIGRATRAARNSKAEIVAARQVIDNEPGLPFIR
jgi:hypothetical protein